MGRHGYTVPPIVKKSFVFSSRKFPSNTRVLILQHKKFSSIVKSQSKWVLRHPPNVSCKSLPIGFLLISV
jgi:hypothetical protein